MKKLLLTLALLFGSVGTAAADITYEGTWVTTNVPLEGTMTAVVKDLGNDRWSGRFYGIWQGRKFSYDVEWTGKPGDLTGKAVIDGARYTWKGKMAAQTPGEFEGTFTGSRYTGSFKLKEKR